ncbi:fixl-related histidine kinase, partial [Thalassiosira pseudonana CCMP1335]
ILAKQNLTSKIIDASYDALFVINQRGIIHMVNATSTIVFGWTREEFLGNNINMIMPPEHAKKHDGYLERFMRTGERRMMGTEREVEAVRKDNTRFPCILGLSEVSRNPGEDTIFCGFIRSLAQKKDMERQLTD